MNLETLEKSEFDKDWNEVITLLERHEGRQFCWGPFLQADDGRGKAKITETGELLFELVVPLGDQSERLLALRINAAEKQFPLQYGLLQEKKHGVTKEMALNVISGTIIVTASGKQAGGEEARQIYEVLLDTAVGVLPITKSFLAFPDTPFQVPCK